MPQPRPPSRSSAGTDRDIVQESFARRSPCRANIPLPDEALAGRLFLCQTKPLPGEYSFARGSPCRAMIPLPDGALAGRIFLCRMKPLPGDDSFAGPLHPPGASRRGNCSSSSTPFVSGPLHSPPEKEHTHNKMISLCVSVVLLVLTLSRSFLFVFLVFLIFIWFL